MIIKNIIDNSRSLLKALKTYIPPPKSFLPQELYNLHFKDINLSFSQFHINVFP